MNIVWFSWKDISHPRAGGAENISWHLMKDLQKQGHSVRLITAQYPGSAAEDKIDGITIKRGGNRVTVYYQARKLYKKYYADWADALIDEMNTVPFGCTFYSKDKKTILHTYQLARSVWFYQLKFPFSLFGYLMEPIYLRALSRRYDSVETESESTKADLVHYGFKPDNIGVFRVGIELKPLSSLDEQQDLSKVLILGAMRPMKRTLSAIKGFEYARDFDTKLTLTIAGDNTGRYASRVLNYIDKSRHKDAIHTLGQVSAQDKIICMQEAAVILVTSIKEGWGLIVTEANSQGTPAIAYDCDGLRDSVTDGVTGKLVKSGDEKALGKAVVELLSDKATYEPIRRAAWESSKKYTFKASYEDFSKQIGL